MPVLGILTCEILELEIAYLLKNDPSVSHIFVITHPASQGFIKALEENGVDYFTPLESIDDFSPPRDSSLTVLVHVLELGLHSSKSKLQQALVMESQKLESCVEALFLGYGLCGNALSDPDVLLSHLNIPFFLPWDKDHPVDDCVGLFIGGRDAYYEEQVKEAGTFFMTPGWTNHWNDIFEKVFGEMSLKMGQRIFKHYKRTLLISNPVMAEGQMRENIQDFNHRFNCYSEICPGSMDMLTEVWNKAKTHVLKASSTKAINQILVQTWLQNRIKTFEKKAGRRPRILLTHRAHAGKDRNIKFIASLYADLGFDVDISPGFQTSGAIARMAVENDVHAVGILGSIHDRKLFETDLKKALALEKAYDIRVVFIPFAKIINNRYDKSLEIETITRTLNAIGAIDVSCASET